MAIVQQAGFEAAPSHLKSYDSKILVGYAAFAILLLIAIYFDSMSSGMSANEFATMTVFP
jgi:hypothetical protein